MKRDFLPRKVVLLGGARTPIGSFLGALRAAPAPRLAAAAAAGALQRSGVAPAEVQQCVVGQVVSSSQGKGAFRAALQRAGIPASASVYTVNGSCPTGLKAACLAATSVALGETPLALAVGVESLSNAPYLLLRARQGGYTLGDGVLVDSLVFEGLRGSEHQQLPGKWADAAAVQFGISREECDNYAVQSFKRAADATSSGFFRLEGLLPFSTAFTETPSQRASGAAGSPQVPQLQQHQEQQRRAVAFRQRRQQQQETPGLLQHDEEVQRLSLDRLASANPVFGPEGLTTSENAFKLGDGAAALVLAADEDARKRGLKPLARILAFADAAQADRDTSLALVAEQAMVKALRRAGLERADLYEIHEVFAALPLLLMRRQGLCPSRVNLHGGAISLGHPLGMSGIRMVLSLTAALRARELLYGCAVICNGADAATAIVLEAL